MSAMKEGRIESQRSATETATQVTGRPVEAAPFATIVVGPANAAHVLALQRTAGNGAVSAMLARCRSSASGDEPCECELPPLGVAASSAETTWARALLARQAIADPMAPGPGGGPCLQILGEVLSYLMGGAQHVIGGVVLTGPNIHRGLVERYQHMRDDASLNNLYRDHRTPRNAHPRYGSWEGHQQTYRNQARGLRDRLNDWARNGCDGPDSGVPEAARNEVQRAWDYATRQPPNQPAPLPRPVQRSAIDTEAVLDALKILGVSLLLLGLVIVALLDPEPVSKLAAIGMTAATATMLLVMLGLREDHATSPTATAQAFPEEEEALV
jgi:hypothetical protein